MKGRTMTESWLLVKAKQDEIGRHVVLLTLLLQLEHNVHVS